MGLGNLIHLDSMVYIYKQLSSMGVSENGVISRKWEVHPNLRSYLFVVEFIPRPTSIIHCHADDQR